MNEPQVAYPPLTEREQFEEYFVNAGHSHPKNIRRWPDEDGVPQVVIGKYISNVTQGAWEAWQASVNRKVAVQPLDDLRPHVILEAAEVAQPMSATEVLSKLDAHGDMSDAGDSFLLCVSDLQHSAIYDNPEEMKGCIQAVTKRLTALADRETKGAEPVANVDKAWAQFCAGVGDGPGAPYPGMIGAFERHYGQSFAEKDFRNEAAAWAQAWKYALQTTTPAAQPLSAITKEQP